MKMKLDISTRTRILKHDNCARNQPSERISTKNLQIASHKVEKKLHVNTNVGVVSVPR